MIGRRAVIVAAIAGLALIVAGWLAFGGWYGSGPLEKDRTFIVSTSPLGTTTASVATFIFSISETTETLTCRRRLLIYGAAPGTGGSYPRDRMHGRRTKCSR